jgi:SRSO17 transposase
LAQISQTAVLSRTWEISMDVDQICGLEPELKRYLREFDACFERNETRRHLPVYVRGQLSDLPRKSVEPMALAAGVAPRTLQEFLSLLDWDEQSLLDRVQQIVARDHANPHAVGVIDETGCPKKGTKTPGVQRQYCGATGKVENCVVTVHLSYAADDFHCLLDSDLFLPKAWSEDRKRCQEAGIPDDVVYRPKWQIALELLDRADASGVRLPWVTFDEYYGSKPQFLQTLHRRQQRYVGEVPLSFRGWLKLPRLRANGRRGQGRSSTVANLLRYSPALRDQPWQRFRIKDGEKGPMVWEVKHVRFYAQRDDHDPAAPGYLIVARNVLKPEEVKYFVSNAPPGTRLQTLLLVAFSRWHVERCFEDEKTELGFDHYEGRKYQGLIRHQAICAVSHLFLERIREQWGEKSGLDGLPTPDGGGGDGAIAALGEESEQTTLGACRYDDQVPTTSECQGSQEPHQDHRTKASPFGNSSRDFAPMLVG